MNEPSSLTLIPYPSTSPDPLLIVRPIVDPEERFTECKNLLYDNDLTALSALLVGDSAAAADDDDGPSPSISFVDYQDSGGQTLLHVACFQGHANAVDLLIKLGANIELKNLEDRLPVDVAVQWDHDDCAELIRCAGGRCSLEETIAIITAKNIALLRALDLEKRKVVQKTHALETSQTECTLIRQERDEAIYQSMLYLKRAELAEKSTSHLMDKLHVMTTEKVKWEKECVVHVQTIKVLNSKLQTLGATIKKTLIEKHALVLEKINFDKKYFKLNNRFDLITTEYKLLDIKYEAAQLKLILLSKELRKRDIEVVRLASIEKKAKAMQRAVLNYKSQTLMEALHKLVPVEILSGAFRTLQSLARAGERAHPYYGGKNVKKPGRRGRRRPATASLGKRMMAKKQAMQETTTMHVPMRTDSTTTASTTRTVDRTQTMPAPTTTTPLGWKGAVKIKPTCRLLGGVALPFPLLAVTPGGVRCIVVTHAKYNEQAGKETLTIVDGVSAEDMMVDHELAPAPTKEHLNAIDWLDGHGRWSALADKNVNTFKRNRHQKKKRRENRRRTVIESKKSGPAGEGARNYELLLAMETTGYGAGQDMDKGSVNEGIQSTTKRCFLPEVKSRVEHRK